MTKYSVCVKTKENPYFESIALFADNVPRGVLGSFTYSCFSDWEEVTAADCVDLDTGEVLYSISTPGDEIPDDVDESNYNPYTGCDEFDQEGYDLCWGEG